VVRRGRLSDKDRVVELLRDSRVGAGFDRPDGISGFVFPYDKAYAERLFLHHVGSPDAACFVFDVDGIAQGILMMVAFDHSYGPVRVSKDSMWWIDPTHRGGTAAVRMLDAAEEWARSRGCAFGGIAGMGGDPNIARLLERRGYRAAEVHYLKPL